jgi:hypothetical protein
MANYTNKLGDIYTQDELEAAALENGVDINTIITDNELIQEEPGKGKSAIAKGSTVALKKKRTLPTIAKSASSSKSSLSESNGKNPFGKEIKTFSQQITEDYQAIKKKQPTKTAAKTTVKDQETDSYAKAMQETMDYFTETRNREVIGLEPTPAPGSFGRKKFEQEEAIAVKKSKIEKKKAEDEKTKFGAKIAELDLKYSPEASASHREAMAASELTDDENSYLDGIIKTELSKNGIKRPSVTSYDEYGNPITDIADEKPYVAFEKQRKNVIKKLKADGVLDKYSEKQIAEEAANLWKDQELNKIKTDKYTRHLKENKNLSKEARSIIDNYGIKKVEAEELEVMESSIARNRLVGEQDNIAKQILNIDSKLKPKEYKFKTQSEVDQQNKLIEERNELVGYYTNNDKIEKTLSETISAKNKNIKDLSLAYDMLKRDYSTLGYAKERGIKLKQWANEFLLAGSYLVDIGINIVAPGDGAFKMNAATEAFADNAARYSDALNNSFAKDIQGTQTIGEILTYTGDLTLDFAPDLIAMIYTGGGATAAKGAAKEVVKRGLLSKVGSALTISKETAPITARVVGSKYGEMVNEQKFGYYDEDGNKIMPNYNSGQLMLVPIAYGYMEGLGEKATAGIIKRNSGFWKLAKEANPDEWWKFGKGLAGKLDLNNAYSYVKKYGKEIVRAQVEEQPSEFLTYVGQDLADKFLLGKEVNLLENTGTVFKDTGLLTLALSAVPMVGGMMVRPFMSQSTSDKMVSGATRLAKIENALNNEQLTEVQRVELEKEKIVVSNAMQGALNTTVENINDMPVSVYNSVNASATKVAALINKANEINDSDIDPEQKKKDLEALSKEYTVERLVLNSLTRSIESVNTFGKPINSITRGELIGLQAERVAVSFNDTLSKDQKNDNLSRIDKKIESIYAANDINIIEERTKEYEQTQKVAQKLASSTDVKIIEGNTGDDLLAKAKALQSNGTISLQDLSDVEDMIKDQSEGMFSADGKFIFIQKDAAIKNKAVTVGSHEFLHKLLEKTMQNATTQINLGRALADYLIKTNPDLYLNDKVVGRQYGNYDPKDTGKFNEELLTIFSDALLKGEVKYNESVFTKLGDIIRRFFQDLGISNIKFNSGVDVYNFIKDYNNTISKDKELKGSLKKVLEKGAKGSLVVKEGEASTGSKRSKSIEDRMDALEEKLASGEIDIDIYEVEMNKLEKEEYELSKKQYEEEKATVRKEAPKKETTKKESSPELSDAATKAKAKLDAIGNDPKGFNSGNPDIYSELDKMVKAKSRNWRTANGTVIDFTNKDKGGIDGFDMDEMVSFVRTSMIPYIAKFDPSKNNSLYGYINAQYANRMKAALKSGEVADVVFTEDVSEMTKLSQEDVETTKPTLPERKRYQNILESGVFSPEVIEQIQAKILPIIRTLKTKIDEKVSLNRTVAPIISEIQNEMGKQADIDIKQAMGGKEGGELKRFLLSNKKAILENMTTTWLMGKDGRGGMPFAIQKRINGNWVNFPDWVSKKIDRESVATDLAGRTSGHELVRRLPNVNNNVDNETFLASIIDLETGAPIRGRKESLAKAMAEEISMDIISDDMANEGVIFQALEKNQEMLGAALDKVIEQEFNRLAERGNVKFSITKELQIGWKNALNELNNAKTDEAKRSLLQNKNSVFNKFMSKIYNLTDDEFKAVKDLILKSIGSKGGIYWWANEKALQRILRKQLKGYDLTVRAFGGTNNSVADIVIKEKGDNLAGLNIEAKKAANKNIPITSFTSNSMESKEKNGSFNNSSENVKNTVKEIISYKSDLKSFVGNIGEVTDAGNIKLTKEQFTDLLNKVGSKRYIFKETPVSIEFVKAINELKFQPNDFIIIKNRIFDYFKGYLGVDNIENAFVSIDNLPENLIDNIFSVKTEFQLNDKTSIASTRSYIVFNDKIKLTNNEVVDASGIINEYISKEGENISDFNNVAINNALKAKRDAKYSKSAENNLNFNDNFNSKISNVSDYINKTNIRKLSADDSFDLLNDLSKRVEDFWGVVSNETIIGMDRSIAYAAGVIEDREGAGSMMAALNEGLNLETVKNAEKQLNEFVQNNINKKPLYSKSLDFEFNKMLEENTGVDEFTKISDVVAKRTGRKANRFSFFVPPSADDFMGLTSYMFAGKGKKGEADQEFFDRNLIVPYVKGINTLDSVRQAIKKSYKELLSQYPTIKKKLEKLTPDGEFTYDQAIRVYLWNKGGIEVPGLSKKDKGKLTFFVKQDLDLIKFANALSITGRQNGSWTQPSATWDSETIISDLHNITEGDGRKKWLQEFIENSDFIFSKQNLNKVESIYGTNVRQALEDSLYRMKNGKARPAGADRLTNIWMNWINGSTAAIMFFNTRSALLQTISALNFINFSDNNPYQAAKAFANQKQYWSDFAKIINSDKLKERRSGLKSDVTQAEIANAANDAKNKFNGIISYLQKIGFTPTQAADSFAIAISGATFYRNRVNTYLKNGLSEKEAEDKAWIDFSIITDKSMQSADPMYVSKQQTTALGRLILAFGNTPMQYNRLIKKASLDLINRRGNWKENVSKIIYYGALQNFIFSSLQAALFLPFDDEDDEVLEKMTKEERKEYDKLKQKQENKVYSILNSMLDTVLRGSGVGGAALATIKNAIVEYDKQEERKMFADHAYTILAATSVSPPISSKLRKLYSIHRTNKFEKDVVQERGWEVSRAGRLNLSPKYDMVGAGVTAITNIPLDRLVEKTNNIAEALDNRNTALQRTALILGWKEWELNVKNEENEVIKKEAKVKRKAEGIEKGIETRRVKKEAEKEAYKQMTPEQKFQYRRKKSMERRERAKKKRENRRKMG